jgi:hypothetical protein
VQSAATSSEVRFSSPAALAEYRAMLGRYPTRQPVLLPTLRALLLKPDRGSTDRLIDELARRAD